MDKFEEEKAEEKKVKDFHRSRQMFASLDGKLLIAEPNLPYSHAEWFETLGYSNGEIKDFMQNALRGIVDSSGDIFFYGGDFELNKKIEKEFFQILPELMRKLNLKPSAKIFGGMIKKKPGELWPPKKSYGSVEDH